MDEYKGTPENESGKKTNQDELNPKPLAERSTSPAERPARPRRRWRWLMWVGVVLLVIAVAAGVTVAILLHRAEPMLRAALVDTLQKRFHSRVELDDLRVSVVDGFRVEGRGLRIWLPEPGAVTAANTGNVQSGTAPLPKGTTVVAGSPEAAAKPWISLDRMWFHVAWHIRPGEPIVISVVHVNGVNVLLPPKEDRPHLSIPGAAPGENVEAVAAEDEASAAERKQSSSGSNMFKLPEVLVRRIECQDAKLSIERTQEPGKDKPPLRFEFANIELIPDGHGGPVGFSVDMTNAKPVGKIHTTGHLGPWVPGDPGELPVNGTYTFNDADLGTIKGIAGILSSTGHYTGTLNKIEAEGTTETPDFRLERVHKGSGVRLKTHYQATVDGTNGNTYLHSVDGMLGRTHILAKGQVVRADDVLPAKKDGSRVKGHDIVLEVTVDRGRIDDILAIAADADQPFMTGNLTMQTHFHLPPGKVSVWDKLLLDGKFHLSQTRFTSDKMQGRIKDLSLRGQGKPNEAKTTDPTTVMSEMQGHFKLANGKLQLPDLDYRVPGASIVAHGVYGFDGGTLNFEGDAKLDASLSQVVGGWKGFLLKPADRIFKKNGAGTDVPIHVDGTRKDPKFGVDFGRIGKNTEKRKGEKNEDGESGGDPK